MGLKRRTKRHHNNTPICFAHLSGCSTNHLGLRREAGREGCLWPNAASQGRPPDGSGGESERSTQNGRAKTLCGGGGGSNSELPQAGFPESGEVCEE